MRKNPKILSGIILPFALLSSILVPANGAAATTTEANDSIWTAPNDTHFGGQWNLRQLNIPKIWERTKGKGQVVAVLDSGIVSHIDLDSNILPGYDMVGGLRAYDGNGIDDDPTDEGSYYTDGSNILDINCYKKEHPSEGDPVSSNSTWHGTHVAGIIAAVANNGTGIAGVASEAKILPVRVNSGCGTEMVDLAYGIRWAAGDDLRFLLNARMNENPATVINISLGDAPEACDPTLQKAINYAVSKNIPVVVAAGNKKNDALNYSPANCDNVIVVASSTIHKTLSKFSNFGSAVDITAPGGSSDGYIYSTSNRGITKSEYIDEDYDEGFYLEMAGTSQAAPLVAGTIALMRSVDPRLTPSDIENILKRSATRMDCTVCGAGLINPTGLFSDGLVQAPDAFITGYWNTDNRGYPRIGEVLKASYSAPWNPQDLVLSYQWQRDNIDIIGATSDTYTLTEDDLEKSITFKVTASSLATLPFIATSRPTNKVYRWEEIVPDLMTRSIDGNLTAGSTITFNTGKPWEPYPVAMSYQWYRGVENGLAPKNWSLIEGENNRSYRLTDADVGKIVRGEAKGTKHGYFPVTSVADTESPIAWTENLVGASPKINGDIRSGNLLTVDPGTWEKEGIDFTYTWVRSDIETWNSDDFETLPSLGVNGESYRSTDADIGKYIYVIVHGHKEGYSGTSYRSTGIVIQPGENSLSGPAPVVTGIQKVGNLLTANPGLWTPGDASLAYQWFVNGSIVAGATNPTFTIPDSAAGKEVKVSVRGSKAGYTSTLKFSSSTQAIAKGSLITTPSTIEGTMKVGNRLTVKHAAWGPAPVAITYQWYRSGILIQGATASSYLLTAEDRGKVMTVHVTGRKTGYTALFRKSAPTVAIGYGDLKGSFPTLTGTPDVNNTLIASPGLWTAGVTVSYQWYRDGVLVPNASGRYYKLTTADLGKQIKVRVLGKKTGYTSRAYYSLPTAKVAPAIGDGSHMLP